MNKEFCTYEQALALKELGFDEPCLAGYIKFRGSGTFELAFYKYRNVDFNTTSNIYVSAPLKQQVFKWFREKYNFVGTILGDGFNGELKGYYYSITEEGWINYYESIDDGKWYDTYEEAEDACLNKLIEILKNKQ
jgi:hypothetical protein